MNLIWSEESLLRLIEIEDFIAEDTPPAAVEFIDHLISQAELILGNPEMGRIVPEFSNPEIRELLIRGYRMVCRRGRDTIMILTVFEGHRLIRKSEIVMDL